MTIKTYYNELLGQTLSFQKTNFDTYIVQFRSSLLNIEVSFGLLKWYPLVLHFFYIWLATHF